MSDKCVQRAINESIEKHRLEIHRCHMEQARIAQQMVAPGITGYALITLTNAYQRHDERIGECRTSIRNLQK